MAILFNGRFDNAHRSQGLGGANFGAYAKIDRDPVTVVSPVAAGEAGSYEFVENFRGYSRVAKITTPVDSTARCELRPYVEDPTGPGPVYGTRWYWWSTLIPDDWTFTPARGVDTDTDLVGNQRVIIGQIHETSDGGDAVHFPPVQLYLQNRHYTLCLTADANATTTARVPNLKVLGRWPVRTNRWEEWVIHTKLAADTTGFLHFYRNRRLLYSLTGAVTTYNDTAGLFMKAGCYWFGDNYSPRTRVLYSRGIVIGDANSSYAEVSGKSLLDRPAIGGMA